MTIFRLLSICSRYGNLAVMAKQREEKTQAKVPSVLHHRQLFTETVQKGGVTLHRARFAGFSGKSDARETCNVLKKNKISCLALIAG